MWWECKKDRLLSELNDAIEDNFHTTRSQSHFRICSPDDLQTHIDIIFVLLLNSFSVLRTGAWVPVRAEQPTTNNLTERRNEGTKERTALVRTLVRTHTRRVDIAIAVEYSFVDGSITRNSLAHRSRRCHAVAPLSQAFLSFRRKPALWYIHQLPGTSHLHHRTIHNSFHSRPGCFTTRRSGSSLSSRQEAKRMRGLRVTGSHPVACRDPTRKTD